MIKEHISIVVIAYKDKNLADFILSLKKNTRSHHSIEVFDQHPIDHRKEFEGIDECSYVHKIWDDIAGPTIKRTEKISNRMHNATHICIITPDTILSPGWDIELLRLSRSRRAVFSGNGKAVVSNKDIFSLSVNYLPFNESTKNQFVTKNFIFAEAEAFHNIRMPDFLKYAGEDEYWTLSFMSQGYEIYSVPTHVYTDTMYRSIENTYHTFSAEHNYNIVVDLMHKIGLDEYKISASAVDEFFEFHNIDPNSINRLPYATNDVSYNPYNLQMHDVDARRFIAGTKAVY